MTDRSRPSGPPENVVLSCTAQGDGTTRLELTGEIDIATVEQVRDAVAAALAEQPTELVLDATAVTFIDSTGLGALLGVRRRSAAAGVDLVVLPSERVARVAELAGIDGLMSSTPGPDVGTESTG